MDLWGTEDDSTVEWDAHLGFCQTMSELSPACKSVLQSTKAMLVATHNVLACAPANASTCPQWQVLVPALKNGLAKEVDSNTSLVRCMSRVNDLGDSISLLQPESEVQRRHVARAVQNLEKALIDIEGLSSGILAMFKEHCDLFFQMAGPKAVEMDVQLRECEDNLHNASGELQAIRSDQRKRENAVVHLESQIQVLEKEISSLQHMQANGINTRQAILRNLSTVERKIGAQARSAESQRRSYYESQILQQQIRLIQQNDSLGSLSQRIQQVSVTLASRKEDLKRLEGEQQRFKEDRQSQVKLLEERVASAQTAREQIIKTAQSLENDYGLLGSQLVQALSAVRELTWVQHDNACLYAPLAAAVDLLKSAVQPHSMLLQSDDEWDRAYAASMLKNNLPLIHSAGIYGRLGAEEVRRINQVVVKVDLCLKQSRSLDQIALLPFDHSLPSVQAAMSSEAEAPQVIVQEGEVVQKLSTLKSVFVEPRPASNKTQTNKWQAECTLKAVAPKENKAQPSKLPQPGWMGLILKKAHTSSPPPSAEKKKDERPPWATQLTRKSCPVAEPDKESVSPEWITARSLRPVKQVSRPVAEKKVDSGHPFGVVLRRVNQKNECKK